MFRRLKPRLIWMDMRMPIMDGFEATRIIRSENLSSDVKIIAATASAFSDEREKIEKAGCDDVIFKPYRAEKILHAMTKHLELDFEVEELHLEDDAVITDLSAISLKELPSSLMAKLSESAGLLDLTTFQKQLEKVAEIDPVAAESLGALADNFQWEHIQKLLAKS